MSMRLAVALLALPMGPVFALDEGPAARPLTIRWQVVKTVDQKSRSFVVPRVTGRDGEKPQQTDVVVITTDTTRLMRPARESEGRDPLPVTFKEIVPGSRVNVKGTLLPDGRVQATEVMVSPPRPPREGDGRGARGSSVFEGES